MDPEGMIDNVSALKEQGGEAGNRELVTAAEKTEPSTVAGQIPVPFQPTVSAVQAEVGELSHDVQRKSKGVNPAILVFDERISGGLSSLATPPFTGRSPAPDFNQLFETPKGVVSLSPSRSCSASSEEALEPRELTAEHVRSLKKALKKGKRHSEELQEENLKLRECIHIQSLDLANFSQLSLSYPVQAEQDVDAVEVDCKPRSPVKSPLAQTLSYPIQAEQNGLNGVAVYQPPSPTRCDSVPSLGTSTQTQKQQELITTLESDVKRLKNLLAQAQEQLQSEHETQRKLKSQHEFNERERTILQKGIEERDIKIQRLTNSEAWLKQKLMEKEDQIEVLVSVHEDQFDKIYRFVEAKSNTLVEGDRCIVCDNIPDKCMHITPDGLCNRPGKEHRQTRLNHKFKVAGLCQSHLYPGGVLEAVCKGNNSWIYDGIDHTSRTPNSCKRRLICALCEPVTSELEKSLIVRMKDGTHALYSNDGILFSVLAYRSMVFSLYHYREYCCTRYRADIKSIIQYGWSCHYQLRYPPTDDEEPKEPVPPALLYLQSLGDEFPATLHLPAVCELDFTAIHPPPPPELGNTVVAIYGCIPPYHYVLLRDLPTADKLQPYSRQIILSIHKRLSEKLKAYYEENNTARLWLQGQRKHPELGQHWWPMLTFGHLKCCLNIRVQ